LRQAFDQMAFWVSHQSRAQRDGFNFMEPQAFISQMRSLCLVRCSFNVGWNSTNFPSFANAPCTVEFYVNRALRLLDELLRNPRKARFYLRTGRLPSEEKPELQEEQQTDKPETSTEALKSTWSAKLDPFVASKSGLELSSKPGLELTVKPGFELSSKLADLDPPHKLHQLSAEPSAKVKMVDAISPMITSSQAEV